MHSSAKTIIQDLRSYNIRIQQFAQLKDGLRLREKDLHHYGHCVTNLNMILKSIKSHPACKPQINQLTAFALIEVIIHSQLDLENNHPQNQQKMFNLVSWVLDRVRSAQNDKHDIPSPNENYTLQTQGQQKKQEAGTNQFQQETIRGLENLYFVSELKRYKQKDELEQEDYFSGGRAASYKVSTSESYAPIHSDDTNLMISEEEVIRSSSKKGFKIFKPKSSNNFFVKEENNKNQQIKDIVDDADSTTNRPILSKFVSNVSSSQLKRTEQRRMIQQKDYQTEFSIDENNINAANISTSGNSLKVPQKTIRSKFDGKSILKQAAQSSSFRLNTDIEQEQKCFQLPFLIKKKLNSSHYDSSKKKVSRRQPQLRWEEVSPAGRKLLVEWLVQINLLTSLALRNFDNLHLICKNGLIFPEIINYKKSRGEDMKYQKNPRNKTEVQANYRKIFNQLEKFPNFSSPLLHRYQFFVPQAEEKAFWMLLKEMHKLFVNQNTRKSLPKDLDLQTSSLIYSRRQNQQPNLSDYEKIKFGRNGEKTASSRIVKISQQQRSKGLTKMMTTTSESSCKQKQVICEIRPKHKPEKSEEKWESIKSSLDIKAAQKPFTTKQQALGNCDKNSYKQLSSKKKTYYESPFKEHVNICHRRNSQERIYYENSMTRSRISSFDCNTPKSSSRYNDRHTLPTVTLEMEIVAINWLRQLGYQPAFPKKSNQNLNSASLFSDPTRNGTLLALTASKRLLCKVQFHEKPKSMAQVRQNYLDTFQAININTQDTFPQSIKVCLQQITEEIIKGNRSLFYALVFYICQTQITEKASTPPKILSLYYNDKNSFKTSPSNRPDSEKQRILQWLRETLSGTLNIKDQNHVIRMARTGFLLTHLANLLLPKHIKMIHQKPEYSFQSLANITKALQAIGTVYKDLNKLQWKAEQVSQANQDIIFEVLSKIRTVCFASKKQDRPQIQKFNPNPVSFVHVVDLKPQDFFNGNKRSTKVLNVNNVENQFSGGSLGISSQDEQVKSMDAISQKCQIQVEWMRKIGFVCKLDINSGVLLARLLEKLTMKTLDGIIQGPTSRAQMLANNRRVIKELRSGPNSRMFEDLDEHAILNADQSSTQRVYKLIREAYKGSYVFMAKRSRDQSCAKK